MDFNVDSIGFWLSRRAELSPNKIAIDFEDQTITYQTLNERANRAAGVFGSFGVRKGDRVAVLSENRPEYLEIFFACAKIGAILAPVSWRLTEAEISWQIEDSEPSLLVSSKEWIATAQKCFQGPHLELGDTGSYETSLASASFQEPEGHVNSDDPIMILYTSGTTGRPKGAVLTHGNFFWANLNMIINSDIRSDDVSLMFLPMFHIGGWNVNTLAVMLKGGTVVLEKSFDPTRAIELIAKKKITWLMGVPATYLFMSQDPAFENADFSTVRVMVVGGAPMPEALLETYAARGIEVVQGYGLTETAPNALLLPSESARSKAGSAGKPYFFSDTRLMDDGGKLLDPPASGEIVVRGPIVMEGYWRRADATAETIQGDWLHTGDIGRTDEEGFFWVVDRKKDMIITGGENVYPAEIENVLYEMDGIGETAVIGIPDEKWGETVHAIVVPKPGVEMSVEDVTDHCKASLAKFKVPRSIEIRADALPRTPAGKVKKTDLRAPFWEGRTKQI